MVSKFTLNFKVNLNFCHSSKTVLHNGIFCLEKSDLITELWNSGSTDRFYQLVNTKQVSTFIKQVSKTDGYLLCSNLKKDHGVLKISIFKTSFMNYGSKSYIVLLIYKNQSCL